MGTALPKEEEFALASFGLESMVSGFYFPQNYVSNFQQTVVFKGDSAAESNWKINFDYFLRKLTLANKGRRLLLKSPANTGRIKQILELYPDAKFLHIHRNPYEVYASTLHLFSKMLPILSFQKIKKEIVEEAVLVCYEELYRKYFEEKALIPLGNLVEINYSNFVKDPLARLEDVYSDLSITGYDKAIPKIKEELNEYKDYKTNKFELSEETKSKIYKRWKFAFDALGY